MATKIIVISCFVAVASAGLLPAAEVAYSTPLAAYSSGSIHAAPLAYAAPIAKYAAPVAYATPIAKVATVAAVAPVAKVEAYEPSHAQYSYSYDVHDGHTGDSKSQYETRDGDVVHGSYSVVDPDGTKRTVEYTADPHNGFNAVVHREPLAVKVAAVAPIAKYAAPVAYAAAPVYHAAPVQYSAPSYGYHH